MERVPIFRPAAVAAVIAALVLGLVTPTAAQAAPPDAATLVSPASGSTIDSLPPTVSVRVQDPDADELAVTLEGRAQGATTPGTGADDPFTFMVIPDTQNYSDGRQALLEAQLRWVRDSRAALGTAFVAQVGDLVGDWFIERQWNNVSTAFRILDDAAVPNTVLPGNHDFDYATGDVGPYNSHFPPSRYAQASWTTASTRYGGHLGQDQFGADPIDRGNADSYALFSAGGRDFLVLNLEWEAPQYALDWADRVLDAHPDRTVIMATHSFITVNGTRLTTPQRPGGTAPAQLWQDFVRTHCQIRLVVAGHENQGDLGEAHRTDANACGQPVHQILSNYQGRANGGDGWLRYYTFDPAAGTMRATTYSPSLDRYETDASSAFTLPFELAEPQPVPFTPFASTSAASGSTVAAPWSGLAHDTVYEWRAVVDDGTARSTSATWTLRTPPAPRTDIAADAFTRSTTSAWGSADTGGPWTVTGGSAAFSVSGGRGVIALAPSHTREARLYGIAVTDAVVDVQLSSDVASSGGTASATAIGRLIGSSSYSVRVRFEPGGVLRTYLLRNQVALGSHVSTWSPGQAVSARLSMTGLNPTQLAAKVWPTAAAEPAAWQMTANDATAALQSAGIVTLMGSVSSSSAVPTTRLAFDDYRVSEAGSPPPPPPNAAPTATIAEPTIDGRTITLDGTGSTDPDGTIAAYAWQLGDGTTATGATPTHTYATDGTRTITLSVTDDDGATATTTRQVTVATAPPLNAAPTAIIATPVVTGRTVELDSTGSTDPDGTIAAYAWQLGDGTTATGATPTHTYATDGTRTITLSVTDDDGATATTTRQVTVATAPPPTETVVAADTFQRTVTGGWGSADTGGAWSATGGAAAYSVSGGAGVVVLAPSQTREARLGVSTTEADITVRVSSDVASAGGTASASIVGRLIGSATYSARLRFEPNGVLRLYLLRNEVALGGGSYVLPGAYVPGEAIMVRLSVRGTSPTTLGAMIWRASSPAPATWQLQATDSTSGLQAAGTLTVKSSVSASSSVATTRLRYDDYRVVTGAAAP
ncbi:PKD domain-containing protein [Agrococcus sediminis]|uniref:PKD domain-containing protein n=1 Tax=Agrococcus sediminis TaxID=2599924 RepID=UPI00342D9CC2